MSWVKLSQFADSETRGEKRLAKGPLKGCRAGIQPRSSGTTPSSPPFFGGISDFHALNSQLINLNLNGVFLYLISFFLKTSYLSFETLSYFRIFTGLVKIN